MFSLTSLEKDVLQMLLDGSGHVLRVLKEQAKTLQVTGREITGVGFFTTFAPCENAIAAKPSLEIGDVNGFINEVRHGLGFILFIRDGCISMLEGYTYNEPWPDEMSGLRLEYNQPGVRNFDNLILER